MPSQWPLILDMQRLAALEGKNPALLNGETDSRCSLRPRKSRTYHNIVETKEID